MQEQPKASSQPPLDIGVVVSVSGMTARVQPEHHTACSTCGSSSLCFPQDQTTAVLEAVNQAGAKAGDRVVLTRGEAPRIGAALILFGLPVAMTIGGAIIGLNAAGQDAQGAVAGSLAGLALSLLLVRFINNFSKTSSALKPKISRVLAPGDQPEEILKNFHPA